MCSQNGLLYKTINIMKKILTLFIAACCSIAAFAQDNETPYQTKSLANDAISSVIVTTSAGGILVSGQSGQAPRVEVYIKGNNNRKLSKDEIQKLLDENYDLNVTVNGHEVSAIVKNKHDHMDRENSLSISFKIYVPQQVSTDLRTSGGGIQLDNLKGNEKFSTSGGGLSIDRLSGSVNGRTSGGGITVSNSTDDIDLETSGGGIAAKDCSGNITLKTSGGGILLKNLQGHIVARTSGGGIDGKHISGELITGTSGGGISLTDMSGSLEAVTSAGGLNVQMNHVDKYLKLNASAGNIALKLPGKQGFDLSMNAEHISSQVDANFQGTWDKQNVNGSINGGGIKVDVHSNDKIDLSFN
jgi:Putative adhesin